MTDTGCPLSAPANAARLTAAVEDIRQGRPLIAKTMDELQELADDD
jgi:hypothetical protein